MKKSLTILSILFIYLTFAQPVSASEKITAGIKPSNFFYSFDLLGEKISLFFTRDPYEKAKKNMKFADERIAEIEAATENSKAKFKAAKGYEKNNWNAVKELVNIKKDDQKESFLIAFGDRNKKHWGTLFQHYENLPDEEKPQFRSVLYNYEDNRKIALEAIRGLIDSISNKNKVATSSNNLDTPSLTNTKTNTKNEVLKEKVTTSKLKSKSAISSSASVQLDSQPENRENNASAKTDSIFICNGKTYTKCETVGQVSVCPTTGKAYCQMTEEQQYKIEAEKCSIALGEELNQSLQETKDLSNGKGDTSFDSILKNLNKASGTSRPESCIKAENLSGIKIQNSYQQPLITKPNYELPSDYNPVGDFREFLEEQEQKKFNRETCTRLGGASIGDTCVY